MSKEIIKKIKEICIKANPEITELKFGCELLRKDVSPAVGGYMVLTERGFANNKKVVWVSSVAFGDMSVEVEKIGIDKDFEIIGRPIRLADVLLVIERKSGGYSIGTDGRFLKLNSQGKSDWIGSPLATVWNLHKDDLELQNESCINFIYNILKENE